MQEEGWLVIPGEKQQLHTEPGFCHDFSQAEVVGRSPDYQQTTAAIRNTLSKPKARLFPLSHHQLCISSLPFACFSIPSFFFIFFFVANRHISGNSTRSSALKSATAKIHCAQRINRGQAGVSDCFPVATDSFYAGQSVHWGLAVLKKRRPRHTSFATETAHSRTELVCRERGRGREFYKFLSMSGP